MILDLHRQGLSVSDIARRAGLDRKTVRKYIARGLEPPAYKPRKRRALLIDGFAPYLRERLASYPELSGRQLWREVRGLGFKGGYTSVTGFLHDIRPAPAPVFERRFETPAGRQAQVDFAQFRTEFADDPGQMRIVWLFSMVLGHSWSTIDQQKGRISPGVLESVRVTAGHHVMAGRVVRVVQRKRHRGEAYVVVEVEDGSRQLIAVRNTELADGRSSSPDLRFMPGSLRALVDVIGDCRERAQRVDVDTTAPPDQPPGMGLAPARHMPAGRDAVDRAAAAPAAAGSRRGQCRAPQRS